MFVICVFNKVSYSDCVLVFWWKEMSIELFIFLEFRNLIINKWLIFKGRDLSIKWFILVEK